MVGQFPFNNDCNRNQSLLKDLKVGQLNVQFAPDLDQHVKKTLPPSLSGFPGRADIFYYLKVTVVRPKFYQENIRSQITLKFLPIEPPRPPDKQEETFARRKQQFQKYAGQPPRKNSLFKKSAPDSSVAEPPTFQVDARLPNPAILTCNESIPLRVLVQRLGDVNADVYLSMFQIELVGWTEIRAHDLKRVESGSWIIKSLANMNMPLNMPKLKSQTEFKVPSNLWDSVPLPNTVAPSFDTCNISRKYELEIRIGLSHSVDGDSRPEMIVLPLKLPVEVWSGIAPPAGLVRAMRERAGTAESSNGNAARPSSKHTYEISNSASSAAVPGGSMQQQQPPPALGEDDGPPPPSYEDAMAEDFTPVDGPRREYNVPAGEPQTSAFNSDSKSGGLSRRVSERLFSSNAPSGPRRDTQQSNTIEEEHSYTEDNPPPLPTRSSTTEKG
jgi:hypothetical protein